MDPAPVEIRLHASAVAGDRGGLLILGPSGSGKSSLALALVARGARLVCDDAVVVRAGAEGLTIGAPEGAPDLIEARGIGLLRAPLAGRVPLVAVVPLDRTETERLPPARTHRLLDRDVTALWPLRHHEPANPSFADALTLYLRNPEVLR